MGKNASVLFLCFDTETAMNNYSVVVVVVANPRAIPSKYLFIKILFFSVKKPHWKFMRSGSS